MSSWAVLLLIFAGCAAGTWLMSYAIESVYSPYSRRHKKLCRDLRCWDLTVFADCRCSHCVTGREKLASDSNFRRWQKFYEEANSDTENRERLELFRAICDAG